MWQCIKCDNEGNDDVTETPILMSQVMMSVQSHVTISRWHYHGYQTIMWPTIWIIDTRFKKTKMNVDISPKILDLGPAEFSHTSQNNWYYLVKLSYYLCNNLVLPYKIACEHCTTLLVDMERYTSCGVPADQLILQVSWQGEDHSCHRFNIHVSLGHV